MPSTAALTDKSALIEAHLPLVKRIAYHMMGRLPASVEVDDLIQAGLIGLLDAVNRYEDNQGAQFVTYATQRIRGAMLDELRGSDWASRTLRQASRQIENAINALQQRLQRPPTEQEIAGQMGMNIQDYFELLNETRGAQLVYYEDMYSATDEDFLERFADELTAGPFETLSSQAFKQALKQAIVELPEREKILMGMYYEQEINFKEIGSILGVSESRVCQLHGQAIARLRGLLRDWIA
ncbi:MAG: RNA polymerase sigma factor FliA [Hydrogenophilales bacterium CG03_land_8_20_14_0_80_62_28]|nr:RNA polymerase sigma factor FliA [Betaproteobacteria bacterium]OIO79085.1 MAG: RNA polymerase sigma factor FliA [Hydrogenophilaceae bacterium CG1_02_62_390]PIV24409.1 MAG: RNA polymerase sigma factor FliA [Hydrogenophilales bacterium CG03_land_8_20_14_0_80_62_28]PIW39657.1 MAG: RNA polymerase sigma factor FliA [Hydrogenophilales bacterium CG15_BIG_FIL_POST_REV_8_21_14_020_62_31]PIW71986.1 MAG: RNA polymerase sigma factor FliA [Hydrogenophilales bacterium CG12_big_fil_rev_8_21_14_0_65_61_21]